MIGRFVIAATVVFASLQVAVSGANADPPAECSESSSGSEAPGGVDLILDQSCPATLPQKQPGSPPLPTKYVDCGRLGKPGRVELAVGDPCRRVVNYCTNVNPPALAPGQTAFMQAILRLTAGQATADTRDDVWELADWNCAVVVGPAQVTAGMARAEVVKLVPRPAVGVAPPGGRSLVNIQTVFWVATARDRDLGTVRLLNRDVGLRIHVQRVAWDFGDGSSAETASPGPVYDGTRKPCRAALCPGYFGHVYTGTGARTVTAQVTWSGEFRVDRGAWRPIAGTVTGPVSSQALTILEARSELVPDPGR